MWLSSLRMRSCHSVAQITAAAWVRFLDQKFLYTIGATKKKKKKYKLKQQDTTMYLLDGPNLEHWQHQILMISWSKRNTQLLLVGMENSNFGRQLSVFYKTKHTLNYQIQQSGISVFAQRNWKHMFTRFRNYTRMLIGALFIVVKT